MTSPTNNNNPFQALDEYIRQYGSSSTNSQNQNATQPSADSAQTRSTAIALAQLSEQHSNRTAMEVSLPQSRSSSSSSNISPDQYADLFAENAGVLTKIFTIIKNMKQEIFNLQQVVIQQQKTIQTQSKEIKNLKDKGVENLQLGADKDYRIRKNRERLDKIEKYLNFSQEKVSENAFRAPISRPPISFQLIQSNLDLANFNMSVVFYRARSSTLLPENRLKHKTLPDTFVGKIEIVGEKRHLVVFLQDHSSTQIELTPKVLSDGKLELSTLRQSDLKSYFPQGFPEKLHQ